MLLFSYTRRLTLQTVANSCELLRTVANLICSILLTEFEVKPGSILVVEDNEDLRMLYQQAMAIEGYKVLIASNETPRLSKYAIASAFLTSVLFLYNSTVLDEMFSFF